MGVSALFLSTAFLAFLIAGYRGALYARGRRKPTEIPLMVTTIALGMAGVFLAPATQTLESAFVPSLGRLLSNVCMLVAAFGWLHLMLYISHPAEQVPARMRTRLITLLIAIAVMAVMFFASSRPTGTGIFTGLYRSQPTLAVYALVYASYLGSAMVDLAVLALRSVRGARTWLRLGMILIASGCLLAITYLIEKVIGVVSELATGTAAEPYCSSPFATVGCTFAVGMPALAVLVMTLGATLPTLGPRLERLTRGFRHRRSLQRLQPLWETLHEALPDLALVTPDYSPGMLGGEISERLYRRVIAIRDGLLALQPYRHPDDTQHHRHEAATAGLTDRRRAPAIEAADIRAALYRRRHDMPPRVYPIERDDTTHQDNLTTELQWLVQVSEALVRDELRPAQS
jgi:hypothetical protein